MVSTVGSTRTMAIAWARPRSTGIVTPPRNRASSTQSGSVPPMTSATTPTICTWPHLSALQSSSSGRLITTHRAASWISTPALFEIRQVAFLVLVPFCFLSCASRGVFCSLLVLFLHVAANPLLFGAPCVVSAGPPGTGTSNRDLGADEPVVLLSPAMAMVGGRQAYEGAGESTASERLESPSEAARRRQGRRQEPARQAGGWVWVTCWVVP